MFSTETWPQPALRAWTLVYRFQKFLVVGAVGLTVNLIGLVALHDILNIRLALASPVAIALSMIVTFILNEAWTWHDRGTGSIVSRLALYVPINTVGLIINWQIALYLERHGDLHYLAAQLIGAGVAAIWNFGLNNYVTWRD